ncbi:hypothetical protein CCR75_001449 [Bremia lactucae]|uniref:FYVE-type domain-containing protein n=1 Tax=Bremia lactucae TaxID=4779 RepID=A0A976P0P6_BRELC|nr:hypothetical protein CCR75_001449 [Bremia lactucae]
MTSFRTTDFIRGSSRSTFHSVRDELNSSMANSTNCANLKHGYNSSAAGYIPGKLPLPNDFFPVPKLSAKEKRYLLGLAKHACKEVVYYSRHKDGPMNWLHLSSADGVDVFQGVDNMDSSNAPQDGKALMYLRGSCKIRATIDEISDFFKLDTPEKMSGYTQTIGKDVLDHKTLLTLATPTHDNPKHYIAINWTAMESPSKLARNRDFCYIECHDEFIDANTKRRGWVQSMHSIRLPFCPPLTRSHGLVRGSYYRSGYIFTESADKRYVEAVHTLHVDIKGNIPNWLKVLIMKRRIRNIADVNHYFQRQRLTHEKLLGDLELPAKERVTRCELCETRFGFFCRRWLCRKCGKVVCNSCGNDFVLDYADLGPKKVRICLECSESVALEGTVAMMDESGCVTEHRDVVKLDECSRRPALEESMILLETRPHSIDDHGFYFDDQDANGLPNIDEAICADEQFEAMFQEQTTAKSLMHNESTSFDLKEMALWEGLEEEDLHTKTKQSLKPINNNLTGHEFATDDKRSATRPRANGVVETKLSETLRLGFGWRKAGPTPRSSVGCDVVSTNLSVNDTTKSEVFDARRSRSRSRSSHEVGRRLSRSHSKKRTLSRHDSLESGRGDFERQRRTQEYFDARNARLTLLSGRQGPRINQERLSLKPMVATDAPALATRARTFDNGMQSDSPLGRQLKGFDLKSPSDVRKDSNPTELVSSRPQQASDGESDQDEEALRLAMSAMRLYEEERGPNLRVANATRQAALAKMMEVYAREIEQSTSLKSEPYSRGTISGTRQLHPVSTTDRLMRRTVSDDRPTPFYDPLLQNVSETIQRPQSSRQCRREDTFTSMHPAKQTETDIVHRYRDLSDLSSSAFQAFQLNSLHPDDMPLDESDNGKHDYDPSEAAEPASVHFPRGSSLTNVRYKRNESSDDPKGLMRLNSMFGVADSDTFSDMDLTDLPHLMRKHDVDSGTVSSGTDLQLCADDQSIEKGDAEGIYESRLSDLLSSIQLENVQVVEDDDSASQSSNASFHIEWQSALPKPFEGKLTQDVEHAFDKLPSLSNLLSEYCDSSRSSYLSDLEFEGSQPELEPEYLEAIANASITSAVLIEEQECGPRRSSLPSESSVLDF